MSQPTAFFAPELFVPNGTLDLSFYEKAFGAEMIRCFKNDDSSIHVAEFSLIGTLFHVHEASAAKRTVAPSSVQCTTVLIGLFVPDTDALMLSALAAGAQELSPAQNYDYGYRQGIVQDPFGHQWMIQQKI